VTVAVPEAERACATCGQLRVSGQSERRDRAIVNAWIGMVNTKIGHGEHLDRAS
jgi:hypothetical protein